MDVEVVGCSGCSVVAEVEWLVGSRVGVEVAVTVEACLWGMYSVPGK